MSGKFLALLGLAAATAAVVAGATAIAGGSTNVRATLDGFQGVPAISTAGAGKFTARLAPAGDEIAYRLSYEGVEGDVTQAHIHMAQPGANGGISIWLCSNLPSPPTPAGVQPCPTSDGDVSGAIDADDVVGPSGQGIAAGEFAEFVRAVEEGVAYVNVHSTKFPPGELRGALRSGQ